MNIQTPFKVVQEITADDAEYREPSTARTSQDQVNVKLPEIKVDLQGLHELQEDFTTLRASVWEATATLENLHTRIDAVDTSFLSKFSSLKNQLDRIELSLTPILELAADERKKNSRLEDVLAKLEDVLNQ
jgi:hypothetical protein